jgi:deaminated glutathione amidase
LARTPECSAFVTGIREAAKKYGIAVNVGVHEPANGSGQGTELREKVKNLSLWVDERGEVTQRYQKLHLFDVELGGGSAPLRESE